jgi:REP element-mobilizing transposase RayT
MNVSKRINELCKVPGKTVWQRNYFDHIIRNERSLFRIRQYIRNNPKNWVADAQNHLKNEFGEIDENGNS